ncbi:hypothetical protein U1Q18_022773 [Sarracenia purpurea var. burkii]
MKFASIVQIDYSSKIEEVVLLQALNSVLETHLNRSEIDAQTFCPFLGNLEWWRTTLFIFISVITKKTLACLEF